MKTSEAFDLSFTQPDNPGSRHTVADLLFDGFGLREGHYVRALHDIADQVVLVRAAIKPTMSSSSELYASDGALEFLEKRTRVLAEVLNRDYSHVHEERENAVERVNELETKVAALKAQLEAPRRRDVAAGTASSAEGADGPSSAPVSEARLVAGASSRERLEIEDIRVSVREMGNELRDAEDGVHEMYRQAMRLWGTPGATIDCVTEQLAEALQAMNTLRFDLDQVSEFVEKIAKICNSDACSVTVAALGNGGAR